MSILGYLRLLYRRRIVAPHTDRIVDEVLLVLVVFGLCSPHLRSMLFYWLVPCQFPFCTVCMGGQNHISTCTCSDIAFAQPLLPGRGVMCVRHHVQINDVESGGTDRHNEISSMRSLPFWMDVLFDVYPHLSTIAYVHNSVCVCSNCPWFAWCSPVQF